VMPDMLEGSGQEAVQAGQLGHRQDSFIQQGLTHPLLRLLKSVLQIHDILVWIRIRGSMPLSNGSGSFYFHHRPPRCQQKTNFFIKFFCILLFESTYTSFFKDTKVRKKSENSKNQGFSYYSCFMIEGSGSESVSIPLTNRSGSAYRRPKNMWIRWIRIRIRIRNTG
jgi:hypothetical protein